MSWSGVVALIAVAAAVVAIVLFISTSEVQEKRIGACERIASEKLRVDCLRK